MTSTSTAKNFVQHIPRAVIALVLIAPLLFQYIERSNGRIVTFLLPLLLQSAIYAAGGIQRWQWRQVLGLAFLGAVVYCVTKLPINIALPSLQCRIWHPALVIMVLGAAECLLTCGKNIICLGWTLFACLGAAAAFDVLQFDLLLRYPWINFPSIYGGWAQMSIQTITYWPLLALAVWTTIPIGLLAGQQKKHIRPLLACVVMGCLFCHFWFYGFRAFPDAVASMQGSGPFPRISGAQLLGFRARPEDLEIIWNAMLEGKEQENLDLPDYDWRAVSFNILMEHDPGKMPDRSAARLVAAPDEWLAERTAHLLADQQRYDVAPVLMRYAVQGNQACTQALEQMKIPQAAVGLITQAEYDWARATGPLLMHIILPAKQRGEFTDRKLRDELTKLLNQDAGIDIAAWDAAYQASIAELPSPLSPALKQEVNEVVDCWRKYRVINAKAHQLLSVLWYQSSRSKMLESGADPKKIDAIEQLFARRARGSAEEPPAANDALYATFTQYMNFYKQAADQIVIRGPNWDIPTTAALEKEIDAFEQRVEEAEEKAELLQAAN